MTMTANQIEQAAGDYLNRENLEINHEENNYAAGAYDGFVAGALSRQPEIDTLTAKIAQLETDCEKYQKDAADADDRVRIARTIIEEKRKA